VDGYVIGYFLALSILLVSFYLSSDLSVFNYLLSSVYLLALFIDDYIFGLNVNSVLFFSNSTSSLFTSGPFYFTLYSSSNTFFGSFLSGEDSLPSLFTYFGLI